MHDATTALTLSCIDNVRFTATPGPAAIVPFVMGGSLIAARLRRRARK